MPYSSFPPSSSSPPPLARAPRPSPRRSPPAAVAPRRRRARAGLEVGHSTTRVSRASCSAASAPPPGRAPWHARFARASGRRSRPRRRSARSSRPHGCVPEAALAGRAPPRASRPSSTGTQSLRCARSPRTTLEGAFLPPPAHRRGARSGRRSGPARRLHREAEVSDDRLGFAIQSPGLLETAEHRHQGGFGEKDERSGGRLGHLAAQLFAAANPLRRCRWPHPQRARLPLERVELGAAVSDLPRILTRPLLGVSSDRRPRQPEVGSRGRARPLPGRDRPPPLRALRSRARSARTHRPSSSAGSTCCPNSACSTRRRASSLRSFVAAASSSPPSRTARARSSSPTSFSESARSGRTSRRSASPTATSSHARSSRCEAACASPRVRARRPAATSRSAPRCPTFRTSSLTGPSAAR